MNDTRTPPAGSPEKIGFFITPGYSMMALSAATEPLRASNRMSGNPLYSWHLITENGEPTRSSSGFALVPEYSVRTAPSFSAVFVVASLEVAHYHNNSVFSWLRRAARHGCRMGAVSTGSLLLARAGLLDGYKCTIHWELLPEFIEEFPKLEISRALYCIDKDRLTCAGGTAAMDMMLAVIAQRHGRELAADVADQFLHTRIRLPEETQRMAVQWRYGVTDQRLARAINFMEQNVENVIAPQAFANAVGISYRQLERLFRQSFEQSPARFYLDLRLKHARALLAETTDSIQTIAFKCGFSSPSHFGRSFRRRFGTTPASIRAGSATGRRGNVSKNSKADRGNLPSVSRKYQKMS
jgi:transcriptional regulator GlxA family with amidase domain